ncbi:MAG: HAD-IIIA family hydrolase, partial [Candidatus Omnitrophota bacterium]
LFTMDDLKGIDQKMHKGISEAGGKLRKSFYCLHHPDAGCECRKPKDGLIHHAVGNKKIDMKNSYFIGDTERDTGAGKKFGLKTIAVLTGYCQKKDIKKWKVQPDYIADNLLTAVKEIVIPISNL